MCFECIARFSVQKTCFSDYLRDQDNTDGRIVPVGHHTFDVSLFCERSAAILSLIIDLLVSEVWSPNTSQIILRFPKMLCMQSMSFLEMVTVPVDALVGTTICPKQTKTWRATRLIQKPMLASPDGAATVGSWTKRV